MSAAQQQLDRALNILAKWRVLLVGWQLGTRAKGDPEGDALRDHREGSLIMRAELTALVGLLIQKRVFTPDEWADALTAAAVDLSKTYERRFPGVTANENGLVISAIATEWMKHWKP